MTVNITQLHSRSDLPGPPLPDPVERERMFASFARRPIAAFVARIHETDIEVVRRIRREDRWDERIASMDRSFADRVREDRCDMLREHIEIITETVGLMRAAMKEKPSAAMASELRRQLAEERALFDEIADHDISMTDGSRHPVAQVLDEHLQLQKISSVPAPDLARMFMMAATGDIDPRGRALFKELGVELPRRGDPILDNDALPPCPDPDQDTWPFLHFTRPWSEPVQRMWKAAHGEKPLPSWWDNAQWDSGEEPWDSGQNLQAPRTREEQEPRA